MERQWALLLVSENLKELNKNSKDDLHVASSSAKTQKKAAARGDDDPNKHTVRFTLPKACTTTQCR